MTWVIGIGVFLLINYLVGAFVWSACDDDQQTLFKWFKTAPDDYMQIVPFLTLQCWPVAVWIAWNRRKHEHGQDRTTGS